MATFTLVPGADGQAWFWHRLVPELEALGHRAITMDLPHHDSDGLEELAGAVIGAVAAQQGPPEPLVLVAQSLAGFTAPLLCGRLPVPVSELVLLNAMIPAPGETAGQWWENTGQAKARSEYAAAIGRGADAEFDVRLDFFHDVPDEVTEEAFRAEPTPPPAALFTQPWPLAHWPEVLTRVLAGREDRFFPLEFQRATAKARLGLDVEEIPGGHLAALSRPVELAQALTRGLPAAV